MKHALICLISTLLICLGIAQESSAFLWLLSNEFPRVPDKVVVNGKTFVLDKKQPMTNYYFAEWKNVDGETVWAWTQQLDKYGKQVALMAPSETEIYQYAMNEEGVPISVAFKVYWPTLKEIPFTATINEVVYYFNRGIVTAQRDADGKITGGEVTTYFVTKDGNQIFESTQRLRVIREENVLRINFDGYGLEGSYPWKWQEWRKDKSGFIVYEVCKHCE